MCARELQMRWFFFFVSYKFNNDSSAIYVAIVAVIRLPSFVVVVAFVATLLLLLFCLF